MIKSDKVIIGPSTKVDAERIFRNNVLAVPLVMLIPKRNELYENPPISEETMLVIITHYNTIGQIVTDLPKITFSGNYKKEKYEIVCSMRGLTSKLIETTKRISSGDYWIYTFVGWFVPLHGDFDNSISLKELFDEIQKTKIGAVIYKLNGIALYDKIQKRIYSVKMKNIETMDMKSMNNLFKEYGSI